MDIQELLRKDEKLDAEEGAPAWYVSFADMATLLMATFLMLLAYESSTLSSTFPHMSSRGDPFVLLWGSPRDF